MSNSILESISYEICQVPNYKVNYENSKKVNKPINVLCNILEQDLQLHERLNADDMLKLSIDIDKMTLHNPIITFKKIVDDICEYIGVQNNEISYTQNFSIESGSHHIVIPKYCMKSSHQKEFWKIFKEKYNYKKEIDADIFDKSGWFRLPNQTKECKKGTEHIIQQGSMIDFVLKFNENSVIFPFTIANSYKIKEKMIKDETDGESENNSVKSNYKSNMESEQSFEEENIYKQLLECIGNTKCREAQNKEWTSVGQALKNELKNNAIALFIQWTEDYGTESKKIESENHITKYIKYTPKLVKERLTKSSLHKWAKEGNPKLYEKYFGKQNEIKIANNDNEASEIIYDELKERLIPSQGRLYFKINHIWTNDMETIDNFIMKYILNSGIKKIDKNQETVVYAQNIKSAKNIKEAVYIKVNTQDNPPQIHQLFHTTTKNRIAFLDGVLDFKEKMFYLWKDIHFPFYTTICINRNFKPYFDSPDIKKVEEIKQTIFNPLFGDKMERALKFLSRALSGNYQDKHFGTYLGNRDCGKGLKFDALKCSFEDYVQSFEIKNIMYQRKTNTNNDEVSRKMYWLLDFEFTRLAISQEVPKSEQNMVINSEKLKKLASGGDEQTARRNYDRKDTKFYIDTTFMFMGNDELQFDSKDVKEHQVEFHSVKQFKTKEEIQDMKNDGISEDTISSYGIKDETLKMKCRTDEWKNAIVYLLYNSFDDKPVHIEKVIDDENDETCLKFRLLEKLTITKNLEHVILVQHIKDLFNEDSSKKISNELESLGAFKKKILVKTSPYYGKWCYLGVEMKT
jgi:hypothetical protein